MTGERGLEYAKVDWEADAPRSTFFDDIYYSGDGAEEARQVFIDGNNLAARFKTADRFAIGELGFGAGVNVLVAAELWSRTIKRDGARLDLLSFEKFPLAAPDLDRAHRAFPHLVGWSAALLTEYPPPVEGVHRLRLAGDVTLTLVYGDARDALQRTEAKIDAWFLDGFAPAKNPELWSPEIFSEIARLSAPGATAATFTVAGSVRRALQGAGFSIEKRAGYGRKREMLTAGLNNARGMRSRRAPWFAWENLQPLSDGARVAIIGGGVAGSSLAHELRAAGLVPTIIDPAGIAGGASGNAAGLIMPRPDLGGGAAARFFRAAYCHALRTIAALEKQGDRFFNPCGVLLKAASDEERERQQKIVSAGVLPPGWIEAHDDGLFFPQGGVIDPRLYCARLAEGSEMIKARAERIVRAHDGLLVELDDRRHIPVDAVVIANGCDALRFVEARSLPLRGVMGQIDHFPAAPAPAHAVVSGTYAAPAPDGGLVIGATYERLGPGAVPETSNAATAENISAIAKFLPEFAATLDPAASRPRASIRCQTPDRLPVAGPLPDWNFYAGAYDDLRHGRRRDYPTGRAATGVYILTGLGSRGLLTAPLSAAAIAAEMTGAPSPLEREIAEALHPARFFIRDLKRSQRFVAK